MHYKYLIKPYDLNFIKMGLSISIGGGKRQPVPQVVRVVEKPNRCSFNSSCQGTKTYGSSFCAQHRCQLHGSTSSQCNRSIKKEGYITCIEHSCPVPGCQEPKAKDDRAYALNSYYLKYCLLHQDDQIRQQALQDYANQGKVPQPPNYEPPEEPKVYDEEEGLKLTVNEDC